LFLFVFVICFFVFVIFDFRVLPISEFLNFFF